MEEREAVCRLRRGDVSGLEALVVEYQVRAVRAAFLVTQDRPMAEDVVGTAFLRAYERIHQFDTDRPFGPWFLRMVVNDAIKAASRGRRHVSMDERMGAHEETLAESLPDERAGPEELAERAEVRRSVREALGGLSPSQRAVFVMRYYLELTDSEIAHRLGRSPGTIKRHLHDGRKRLRTMAASLWSGAPTAKAAGDGQTSGLSGVEEANDH